MRIAMIGQKGIPAIQGGVERHVHDLSLGLVENGQEVTVYARKWYSPNESPTFQGVKIKYLPCVHTKHLDAITHSFLATIDAIKNTLRYYSLSWSWSFSFGLDTKNICSPFFGGVYFSLH
jgi:hypothetical protein